MKAIILALALAANSSFAIAQQLKDGQVPADVKQGFEKKYPGVKVEKWEKEGSDYEAEFELNKTESSAVFSPTGTFKELEQEMDVSNLMKPIMEFCAGHFKDYKIHEGAKITDASGKIQYEAELTKGKEHFDALFDDQGNFVKKSTPTIHAEKKQ